jgi:hypothetical protein
MSERLRSTGMAAVTDAFEWHGRAGKAESSARSNAQPMTLCTFMKLRALPIVRSASLAIRREWFKMWRFERDAMAAMRPAFLPRRFGEMRFRAAPLRTRFAPLHQTMARACGAVVFTAFSAVFSAAFAAGTAHAAGATDSYAYRWPLKTEGSQVAWQFELTPEVYAALRDPKLRDLEVFNAEGRSVPVAPLTVNAQLSPQSQWVWMPAFALPRDAAAAPSGDVRLRMERDSAGQLRMLEAQVQGDTASANAVPALIDYVVDASAIRRDSRTATIDRLDLQWGYSERDTRARFAVEASDDLEAWQVLVDAAAVVSLRQQGASLQRRTIALPATAQPYLRLRQLDGDPLPGLQVQGRRHDPAVSALAGFVTRSIAAEYVDSSDAGQGARWYRYRLPAPLPVAHLSIALPTDNATAQLDVEALIGERWMPMGGLSAFRLRQGDLVIDNDDFTLGVATTAREWRLRSPIPLASPPGIQAGYLPDRFVFLAQGQGPYTLAAGSRSALRTPMRLHFGSEWQPPVAALGARSAAGGEAAYAAAATPPNWRGWLLWALLIGGALLVAGFAISLIRSKPAVVGGE